VAGKKLSRNAPCPCGSGKKYKHCCITKGFDWVEDEGGTIRKSVPLPDEAVAVLREQRRRDHDPPLDWRGRRHGAGLFAGRPDAGQRRDGRRGEVMGPGPA
jgi:hypothetical protein